MRCIFVFCSRVSLFVALLGFAGNFRLLQSLVPLEFTEDNRNVADVANAAIP